MLNKFYNDHNLKKFIDLNSFRSLERSSFKKGETFFLDHMFFIINGSVELFLTNDKNDTMKLSNINSQQYIIGIMKSLNYKGVLLFYKATTDVELISIPNDLFTKLDSDCEFLKISRNMAFNHLMEVTEILFIRSMYSSKDILRYTLEKNTNDEGEFFIDDLNDFLTDNNLSRSVFYNTLKSLEKDGEIKKIGTFIKFLNFKFITK